MVSSIKHRKSGAAQQLGDEPSSPNSNGKYALSKHGRTYSSYQAAILSLVFAAVLLTLGLAYMYVLPSSPARSSAPSRHAIRVRPRLKSTAAADPLPFSKLLVTKDRQVPAPLTGVYTLDEIFLLQETPFSNQGKVTGSIKYPHVDLSTLLKEEATEPVKQRKAIGKLNWKINQASTDESFLTNRLIKSVIAHDEHKLSIHEGDALLTRCGYKMGKIPNQDRSLIAHFFLNANAERKNENKLTQSALLMGIFDGHGGRGHEVSHFIALELPRMLTRIMRERQRMLPMSLLDCLDNEKHDSVVVEYMRKVFTETFLQLDAAEPVKGQGGSTASVLFYPGIDSKVYIANTGDSTTIIAAYSKSKKTSTIIFMNRKHKPHLPDERQRIEDAGGQVMIPPSVLMEDNGTGLKETSRLIIPDSSGFALGGMALAMSRSIGDVDGKIVGLIAEPEVDVLDMGDYLRKHKFDYLDTDFFAIVASDGVYDVLTPDVVADYLGKSLYGGHIINITPLEACERIIREASRLWKKESQVGGLQYRDDITVGVSNIDIQDL